MMLRKNNLSIFFSSIIVCAIVSVSAFTISSNNEGVEYFNQDTSDLAEYINDWLDQKINEGTPIIKQDVFNKVRPVLQSQEYKETVDKLTSISEKVEILDFQEAITQANRRLIDEAGNKVTQGMMDIFQGAINKILMQSIENISIENFRKAVDDFNDLVQRISDGNI